MVVGDYAKVTPVFGSYGFLDKKKIYKIVGIDEYPQRVTGAVYSRMFTLEADGNCVKVFEVDLTKVNKEVNDMYNENVRRAFACEDIFADLASLGNISVFIKNGIITIYSGDGVTQGVAVCHPGDTYSVVSGLALAIKRLKGGGFPLEGDKFYYIGGDMKVHRGLYKDDNFLQEKVLGNVFFLRSDAELYLSRMLGK